MRLALAIARRRRGMRTGGRQSAMQAWEADHGGRDMRVVQATKFGGPEVLVPSEAPEPVAGPWQVVVEVSVAPVLFLDTQIRSGLARTWFPATTPYPAAVWPEQWVLWGRVWTLTGWAAGLSLIPPRAAVTWSGPWSR
jgi:hypothetical protein